MTSRPSHISTNEIHGYTLNDGQFSVMDWKGVPAAVNAPAGSGKTHTMLVEIVNLIRKGFKPELIMVTTFTKDAAEEMKRRLAEILGWSVVNRMCIGTTHSIFWRWLREYENNDRWFRILGTSSARDSQLMKKAFIRSPVDIVEMILKTGKLMNGDFPVKHNYRDVVFMESLPLSDEEKENLEPRNFMQAINLLHSAALDPGDDEKMILETVNRLQDPDVDRFIIPVYAAYEQAKEVLGVIDFNDMLTGFRKIVVENPKHLAQAQKRYRVYLVDEAQDLNTTQLLVVLALGMKGTNAAALLDQIRTGQGSCEVKNILMIGDNSQAIYGWRGASDIFANFPKTFGADRYTLDVNYRSTGLIVKAADKIREQLNNPLTLTGFVPQDDFDPEFNEYANEESEADSIASKIFALADESEQGLDNYDFSKIAILVRVNALVGMLQIKLFSQGIPFVSPKSATFFDKGEIGRCVDYLRAVDCLQRNLPVSKKIFRSFANYPQRGLGSRFQIELAKSKESCALKAAKRIAKDSIRGRFHHTGAVELVALLENAAFDGNEKQSLQDSWEIIQTAIFEKLMEKKEASDETNNEHENLLMFSSIVYGFRWNTVRKFVNTVDKLNRASVDTEKGAKLDKNAVCISTIHKSKGLEWDRVFLAGLMEGVFPHKRTLELGELGEIEETRLWYVAWTRAKRFVHLSYAMEYQEKPFMPSRFIGMTLPMESVPQEVTVNPPEEPVRFVDDGEPF